MHWTINVFLLLLVCGVLLWHVWARLLAAFVSALATRRGVKVKVESLTMRTATQVLVTFHEKGVIDEIRCRRIQIGWITSACQGSGRDEDEEEEEESSVSVIHKLFYLLSTCRLHIRAVGVHVRFRGCYDDLSKATKDLEDVAEDRNISGGSKFGILLKSFLPMVSFEINDIEVYNLEKTGDGVHSLFRGKTLALDMKRSNQNLMLENVFVCPGKRFVRNDAICNECGLVEINRMSVTSENSLQEVLNSITGKKSRIVGKKMAKLKTLSVDVNSIRVNLDAKYLRQIKSCASVLKRGNVASEKKSKKENLLLVQSIISGPQMPPISVNFSLRTVTVRLPLSEIESEIDMKGLIFDLHTHPYREELNHQGRVQASIVWDKITAKTGKSTDSPMLECQSSRAESKASLCISCVNDECNNAEDFSSSMEVTCDVHVYALHTKLHHEKIESYVSACGSWDYSHVMEESGKSRNSSLLALLNTKINLSLGNGSSLQFVNRDNICMLHHSIDSASVSFMQSPESNGENKATTVVKFSFSGIAMADSSLAKTISSEMHDLYQVLSNDSFSGDFKVDGNGDKSVNVSITTLACKISDTLMKNICSIATDVLKSTENITPMTSSGELRAKNIKLRKPCISLRADLINVDVAILSRYKIEKKYSSINKEIMIESAVAVRIENLSVSRAQSGLYASNGNQIVVLYYEGKSVGGFDMDFDTMEDNIHSKPMTIHQIRLEESFVDDILDRRIILSPVEMYGHADALVSVIHFSKSMEDLLGFSYQQNSPSKFLPSKGRNVRTTLHLTDIMFCLPVSTDRELSMKLKALECAYTKKDADELINISLSKLEILMKGSEIASLKNMTVSSEITRRVSSCSVQNISCSLDEMLLSLPYNRDPGPTFKVLSMYFKACTSLFADLRGHSNHIVKESPTVKVDEKSIQTTLHLNIAKGGFIFEHHPLEAWFARTSDARSHATLLGHLWDEAHVSFMSETLTSGNISPLHVGMQSNKAEIKSPRKKQKKNGEGETETELTTAHVPRDRSWKTLMSRHAEYFIKDRKDLIGDSSLYGDLFKVDFVDLKLCAISNVKQRTIRQAHQDTIDFILKIDEGSKDVTFKQAKLFDVNLRADGVRVMIGGSNQPLFEGKSFVIRGNVALGKQSCGDPETTERLIYIGMHHVKSINIPIKGSCPPVKVFTDITMHAESSNVFFSPGFEPSLGLMGITSKRLVPSDPYYAAKKPPPVPWWDDIRYFWRGKAAIETDTLQIALLPSLSPNLTAMKERLEIDATGVDILIQPSEFILNTTELKAMAFRKTLEEKGGELCGLPVADVKSMTVRINVHWKLPNCRDVRDHHIFSPPKDNQKQQPVFVADIYKASSLDTCFDVSFAQSDPGSDPPRLFIGGEIVSFWRRFIHDWKVPDYIKNQVRKGTYFVRKPKGIKKTSLPQLLGHLQLNVRCNELQAVHFALDNKDPGGGLVVTTSSGDLRMSWKCNEEANFFLSHPPHVTKSSRPQKVSSMRNLEVLLKKVIVTSMKLSTDIDHSPSNSIFRQKASSSGDFIETMPVSGATGFDPSFHPGEPHWVADTVSISRSIKEDESDGNDPLKLFTTRPLKVAVERCSFLTDLEMRDAIWATIEHLIAAFTQKETGHGVVSRIQSLKGAVGESGDLLNLPRAYSHTSDISTTAENNELLSLLLQQKEAADSSSLVSPQATLDLERQESTTAESDILPMTTSLDDANSELKYEVEVKNLQLMLQRDHEAGTSTGRLLLATKAATLRGMISDHSLCMYNITTLDMEDVQAYVSLSSIDPDAKVTWLGISADKEFIAPSVDDTESTWRRIFNPINIHLRHSKYQAPKNMNSRRFTVPSPVFGSTMQRQGEELILKVPEIAAVMDGREFEVLIDVVSFLITLGPTVHTCNSVANLLAHSDDQKVTDEQTVVKLSYRQLESIRNELYGIVETLSNSQPTYMWSKSGPLPFSGGLNVPTELLQNFDVNLHNRQPSDALRNFIQGKHMDGSKTNVSSISGQKTQNSQTMLLLQWSCEQEMLALEDYNKARSKLAETTEQLKRQTQFKNSSRVLIHLNRVVWQLCNQDRLPFVQASIKKVLFDRRRNRDRSGSARFIIQNLDILDATGMLPDGPATSAGVILTSWNPESSYEREPVLRIISTLGVPTSKYDVFEHLDATLHPLSLHLTEQIATACWEYFFPKEDQKSRQEAFTNTVPSKKLASSIQVSPNNKSDNKIIGSHSSNLDSMPEASGSPLFKQDSDVSSRSDILTQYSSPIPKKRESPAVRRKKTNIRLLKRFRYVKLNRAHMRITYQGYPIGIKDRVLVINSYTCENLDGTWRDLLSNVKQRAIFSALFSGLGLQGRKVKELMIGAAPSLSSIELPTSEEEDLSNNRGLLAKFGLKQNKGKKGDENMADKDDLELQKKRALFGEGIIQRAKGLLHAPMDHFHRPESSIATPTSVPSSPREKEVNHEVQRKVAVPLLELTQPLPPEDSSDSDASEGERNYQTARLARDDHPGPLEAGLDSKKSEANRNDPQNHTLPTRYDPNKPPELGVKAHHGDRNSGPRWMK